MLKPQLKQYLISENELHELLVYELMAKWHFFKEANPSLPKFGDYLINCTPYWSNSGFIQSQCETNAEHCDPIHTDVYDRITPQILAKYQLQHLYTPIK